MRVQKGRCRAMMQMWKLSHTYVCDGGQRQTMYHLMHVVMPPIIIARGQTWVFQPLPICQLCQTLGGIYLTVNIEDSMKKNTKVIPNGNIFSNVARITLDASAERVVSRR